MKQLMKIVLTTAIIVAGSTGVVAMADDCGKDDRVSLPGCVWVSGVIRGYGKISFQNNCPGVVTVKVDRPGPDMRIDLPPNQWMKDVVVDSDVFTLSCCPRYSKCSF